MKIKSIVITILFFCVFSYSFAQKSTEVFIPIGKSPGLSGKYTELGKVQNLNLQDSTITIMTEANTRTIKIKGQPNIWLDYSKLALPNKIGTLADIKEGVLIEMKYAYNKPDTLMEWIKVEGKK